MVCWAAVPGSQRGRPARQQSEAVQHAPYPLLGRLVHALASRLSPTALAKASSIRPRSVVVNLPPWPHGALCVVIWIHYIFLLILHPSATYDGRWRGGALSITPPDPPVDPVRRHNRPDGSVANDRMREQAEIETSGQFVHDRSCSARLTAQALLFAGLQHQREQTQLAGWSRQPV